jgi:tripartite-type tricarboxylate transporter receptor subunit TctC
MNFPVIFLKSLFALLAALFAFGAFAQNPFASRQPIEFVVIFPAGSSADVSARLLAEGMAQVLGVPVSVINKPGGGGAIGYKYVASARPDGRTLVWNSNSVSTTYHSGAMDIDFRAFDPVAQVSVENPSVVVLASSPWQTLPELLDYARASPGMLKVGNSGTGSHTHMAARSLFEAAGATALDVPFSASQVMPAVLGGHVDAVVQLPSAVSPHVRSGRLKVLGVLGASRDPVFPDVPTAQETGVKMPPMDLWRGIAVPKGTPKATIARLEHAVEAAINRPEFTSAGQKFGFVPKFLPAAAFGEIIARDDQLIARQVQVLGMARH